MDISALLGASTATAPSALSFGVMGGGIGNGPPSGEGLEGLDGLESFNQLLGNFLSLTGPDTGTGDGTAIPLLTTDEVPGALTLGMGGPTVPSATPSGLGALLGGGFNLTNMTGTANAGNGAKGIEARWAQSGISLLANGSLSGQEMNPEVVAFLNDLSQALTAASPLADSEPVIDGATPAVAKPTDAGTEEGEVDILMALQGGTGTDASLVVQVTQVTIASANSNAPVIPVLTTDTAPSALGVNLTVAGTGLKALSAPADTSLAPTVRPAAAPVIPKLDAAVMTAATPSTANIADPVDVAPTSSPAVEQKAAPIAAPQREAVSIKVASPSTPAPSTAPTAPVVTGTVAATGTEITPATDTVDEKPGAIALPADLAATAAGDEKASVKEMAAAKAASATTISTAGQASVTAPEPKTATPAVTAPATAAPAQESVDKPAVATASDKMTAPKAPTAPAAAASPTPAASPTTAAASSAQAQTVRRSEPAPAETTILTASALPAEPAAEAEADPAIATTANSPTPHTVALRSSSTAVPTTATRPVITSARPATDANAAPVEGEDVKATETVSDEDEAVTNNRMLAPKHVGNEARAEMQADMAGSAQSAGQNQPATRVDTTIMRAETEDNLLSRAISAGAKGHESGNSTDGGSEGGSGFAGAPAADGIDPATAGLHAGDNGKVQGNDFAQSLRQTSGPHRPNAYTPPGQQMAFHVQRAVQDGNDRVSIQLNPYEMGRIDVQLEIGSEGKLRAKVMVENPATLEMLQKDAKNLEKALQDAGLQTDGDSLSFSLQDSGDQAQQRQDQQDQSGYGTGFASDDVEDEDPAIIAQAQIMEFGRVDVRV